MNIPFRNLYLEIIPTNLGKMDSFGEGKGPKFKPRLSLKKSLPCVAKSIMNTAFI
jgi:hypothetical protein